MTLSATELMDNLIIGLERCFDLWGISILYNGASCLTLTVDRSEDLSA